MSLPVATATLDDLAREPLRRDWVLDGQPAHRTHVMTTAPGLSSGQWDCTAGRFVWDFGHWDEVVHVLEGAVHVTGPDGAARTLTAGDCQLFPHGTRWEWHVPEYVRKAFVCRDARTLARRMRKGKGSPRWTGRLPG